MRKVAQNWQDYQILATGDGKKLERWGEFVLLRPDPQIIWPAAGEFKGYHAQFISSEKGGGYWDGSVPGEFVIKYNNMRFCCKLQGFKHTGLFPEQAVNWERMQELVKARGGKPRILNLFAYTGGATVALALAGAEVTHVDAAKAMVERAKMNCNLSGADATNTRYIVDDCLKFVERELRRGKTYDGIIMDPPSYGRGANGEVWKLEDNIFTLVKAASKLLSQTPLFFLINSYSTGLSPTVMGNLIDICTTGFTSSRTSSEEYELLLPTNERGLVLPAGSTALRIWHTKA
jgi:23S rRNA (cytosine1962-C5)-methyltransferase